MENIKELKIFKLNRIKYQELWEDALNYIKQTYNTFGQVFTTASPFSQLLSVVLHMGRMIFYYIEDSITGLNIRTAYRPDQIKGLAMLAGHDASRSIASRGAIRIYYYDDGNTSLNGNVCYMPNKLQIKSKINGCTYTVLFGNDYGKITMQPNNYIDATIIQGVIKLQSATGTGEILQSYNFNERNYGEIDQYYVNIYVNGERWEQVASLSDLGYNQKGYILRTGLTGGIDVFFGNESMGYPPPRGSMIIAEYIVTDGLVGNIIKDNANSTDSWEISGNGSLSNGSAVSLNDNFKIKCLTDVIFGTLSEDIALTQLIAPHTSRSFVLANEINYQYFFKRMNMFSDIEIIQGNTTISGANILQLAYDQAVYNYNNILRDYNDAVANYGADSSEAKDLHIAVEDALKLQAYTKERLYNNTYRDNTIFIYLVPDIKKRISTSQNYFSCDKELFVLSDDEKNNIINLINASGQRLITVENRIISPKVVNFAINIQVKIWENYNEQDVYSAGLIALSDYLLNFTRKDILPISDIISIFENNVIGVDSVKAWFDCDVNNELVYGEGNYGLDDYGDILLYRTYIDDLGNEKTVRDILPLIRGGFVSPDGVEYSEYQSFTENSAYNLIITGYSKNRKQTLEKKIVLT